MGEVIARDRFAAAGLDVEVTSAGVSAEEQGHGMDRRAAAVLRASGYQVGPHTAHRVSEAELAQQDLVIAAEQHHLDLLSRRGIDLGERGRLVTDFVPGAAPGSPLPDPWYGPDSDFDDTLEVLETAMPQIVAHVEARS